MTDLPGVVLPHVRYRSGRGYIHQLGQRRPPILVCGVFMRGADVVDTTAPVTCPKCLARAARAARRRTHAVLPRLQWLDKALLRVVVNNGLQSRPIPFRRRSPFCFPAGRGRRSPNTRLLFGLPFLVPPGRFALWTNFKCGETGTVNISWSTWTGTVLIVITGRVRGWQ